MRYDAEHGVVCSVARNRCGGIYGKDADVGSHVARHIRLNGVGIDDVVGNLPAEIGLFNHEPSHGERGGAVGHIDGYRGIIPLTAAGGKAEGNGCRESSGG